MAEITYQERGDGYRVVRVVNGVEQMLANLITRAFVSGPVPMPTAEFEKGVSESGMEAAMAKLAEHMRENSNRSGYWKPLPREECAVHSAIGPITVADLEAIIAGMPA